MDEHERHGGNKKQGKYLFHTLNLLKITAAPCGRRFLPQNSGTRISREACAAAVFLCLKYSIRSFAETTPILLCCFRLYCIFCFAFFILGKMHQAFCSKLVIIPIKIYQICVRFAAKRLPKPVPREKAKKKMQYRVVIIS